ncbi:hypothetical protein HYV12_04160 [Candidatus Dojkabacteria bacterium]|nr:hypothetical protein [Candidatus Dojkabacteria bacterium]
MKKKEVLIIASIFTLVFLTVLSWSIYKRLSFEERVPNNTEIKGESDLSGYPSVLNVAPTAVKADSVYTFKPLVNVKGGVDNIRLELIQAPAWLYLDDGVLFGIPGGSDVGESKVVVRIWNGDVYIDYMFYLSVDEE